MGTTKTEMLAAACRLADAVDRYGNRTGNERMGETDLRWGEVIEALAEFQAIRNDFDQRSAYAPGSDTSLAASLPRAGTLRRRVLALVIDTWDHGLTTQQLEQRTNRDHTSVSSAVNDLVARGFLRDSGIRRPTKHRMATVYVATDHAVSMWRQEMTNERRNTA